MTAISPNPEKTEVYYPSSDGKPLAETYDHLYAILTTLEVLKQHLSGCRVTVLADQFLYYNEGFPRMRVAPDVMVIFDVEPGGRDNYKIWEEGQVPKVIFEMTSKSTQGEDLAFKKTLYEQLEVQEYWLFDPKGEWISEQLRGYQLLEGRYFPIFDSRSNVLQLRLAIEGKLIGFYREDTGEKLLIPDELASAVRQKTQEVLEAQELAERERTRAQEAEARAERERTRAQEAEDRAEQMEAMLRQYRDRFGDLPSE
ncbi:Uma2 family endonuclease [Phormidium sp. CCY1219]|uniref:Uma2 family endonuclease n=1 Tax=Phormidium sp. CCY1219 TaxID=2886104 RepID=UPI002D1F5B0B|nr:Uma2 family endonuclease [Phormidium sp. CCY1219]MEB3830240.1 Uma2 family endonuclease [Phormidium sp. CCY1219]